MQTQKQEQHQEPTTGEAGSPPAGTDPNAAGGGTGGVPAGTSGGPVGPAAGGSIGAALGSLAGEGILEAMDPTAEDAYWRESFSREVYGDSDDFDATYDDYEPAFRTGYAGFAEKPDRSFEEAEWDLERHWEKIKGTSRLTWDEAKQASRAAWDRVERGLPGGRDEDRG